MSKGHCYQCNNEGNGWMLLNQSTSCDKKPFLLWLQQLPIAPFTVNSQYTVMLRVAVWALMALLAVQVYSPASLRCAGVITRESPVMVILASGLMVAPPLPHWTVISVPAVQVHLKDTFLPSTATVGTSRPIPTTASTGRRGENGFSTGLKTWRCRDKIDGSGAILLRIICCYQRNWKWIRDAIQIEAQMVSREGRWYEW